MKIFTVTYCLFYFPVYFDTDDECHTLDFQFGQNAVGNTKPTSRTFSIKVCILKSTVSKKPASVKFKYLKLISYFL